MMRRLSILLVLLPTMAVAASPAANESEAAIRWQDKPPGQTGQDDQATHEATLWPGLSEQQIQLANQLFDEHWKRIDRRERLRQAQPLLFQKHRDLTGKWVSELELEQLELLLKEKTSGDQAKQRRSLASEFKQATEELFAHYQLAAQLSFKVLRSHWQGMQQSGVARDHVPEYAAELEAYVIDWFHQRSIEDLRIFEKPKPKANERERGEKITAELMLQIKSVQEKHGIHDF